MKYIEKKEVFDKEEVVIFYPEISSEILVITQLYRGGTKDSIIKLTTNNKIDDDVIRICKKHNKHYPMLFIDMLEHLINKKENLKRLHSLQGKRLGVEDLVIFDTKGKRILMPRYYVSVYGGDYNREYYITDIDKKPISSKPDRRSDALASAMQDGKFGDFVDELISIDSESLFDYVDMYYTAKRKAYRKEKMSTMSKNLISFIDKMKDKKFMKYGKGEFDWFED